MATNPFNLQNRLVGSAIHVVPLNDFFSSALFTFLVGWNASSVSLPQGDTHHFGPVSLPFEWCYFCVDN